MEIELKIIFFYKNLRKIEIFPIHCTSPIFFTLLYKLQTKMDHQSQFLPLDSGFISQKFLNTQASCDLNQSKNQICFLLNKITQLQKNYMCIEAKYQRKIKQLRSQLNEKHKEQATLSTQLTLLAKQYEDHKTQIQKISEQIKKQLQNQTNNKQKSKSPKNHINNSPKRLIKKSLEIDKKQEHKKQILKSYKLNQSDTIQSKNTDRTQPNLVKQKETSDKTNNKILLEATALQKQQNKFSQSQTTKKTYHSPKNTTNVNGPSLKKKILFNSSKQLDIFNTKKTTKLNNSTSFGIGFSPTRKLNSSPMGLKKKISQKQDSSNKILTHQSIQEEIIQINNEELHFTEKQKRQVHQNHLINDHPTNNNQVKKPSSPMNGGYLKKKIYSPNANNKISSPIRPAGQIKSQKKQLQVKKVIRLSPNQNKQIKSSKKLVGNSPGHKKIQNNSSIPTQIEKKGFEKLREKVHIPF